MLSAKKTEISITVSMKHSYENSKQTFMNIPNIYLAFKLQAKQTNRNTNKRVF